MNYRIIGLSLLIGQLHALPCPNGQGILYKGDLIDEVVKQCGAPDAKNIVQRVRLTVDEAIYTRRNPYDPSVSQAIVLYRNDRVAQILIIDRFSLPICRKVAVQIGSVTTLQTSCGDMNYQVSNTNFCGTRFGIGDYRTYVDSICGLPATFTHLQTETQETTELIYQGRNPQTIIFENGKLMDWK